MAGEGTEDGGRMRGGAVGRGGRTGGPGVRGIDQGRSERGSGCGNGNGRERRAEAGGDRGVFVVEEDVPGGVARGGVAGVEGRDSDGAVDVFRVSQG